MARNKPLSESTTIFVAAGKTVQDVEVFEARDGSQHIVVVLKDAPEEKPTSLGGLSF